MMAVNCSSRELTNERRIIQAGNFFLLVDDDRADVNVQQTGKLCDQSAVKGFNGVISACQIREGLHFLRIRACRQTVGCVRVCMGVYLFVSHADVSADVC